MNKKFLSAILFGALMVTSTGTFVSCKDYDDDIDKLQTQIDKLATKEDMNSQIASLQSALSSAASEAAAAKTQAADALAKATAAQAAAAQATLDAATAKADAIAAAQTEVAKVKAQLEATMDSEFAAIKTELAATIAELTEEIEALTGYTTAMLTGMEILNKEAFDAKLDLNFAKVAGITYPKDLKYTEQRVQPVDSYVFGAGMPGSFTIKKGDINTVEDYLLVNVDPVNAAVSANSLSLINSTGANLNEFVNISLSTYDGLLTTTRAAANTGLRTVGVQLKNTVDFENFDKNVINGTEINHGTTTGQYNCTEDHDFILYALAATDSKGRAVNSGFDVTMHVQNERSAADINVKSVLTSSAYVGESAIANHYLAKDGQTEYRAFPIVLGETFKLEVKSDLTKGGRVMASYVVFDTENPNLSVTDKAALRGVTVSGTNAVVKNGVHELKVGGYANGIPVPFNLVTIDYTGYVNVYPFWVMAEEPALATVSFTVTPTTAVATPTEWVAESSKEEFTIPENAKFFTLNLAAYETAHQAGNEIVAPAHTAIANLVNYFDFYESDKTTAATIASGKVAYAAFKGTLNLQIMRENKAYEGVVKFYAQNGSYLGSYVITVKKVLPVVIPEGLSIKENANNNGVITVYPTPVDATSATFDMLNAFNFTAALKADANLTFNTPSFVVEETDDYGVVTSTELAKYNTGRIIKIKDVKIIGSETTFPTVVTYNYGDIKYHAEGHGVACPEPYTVDWTTTFAFKFGCYPLDCTYSLTAAWTVYYKTAFESAAKPIKVVDPYGVTVDAFDASKAPWGTWAPSLATTSVELWTNGDNTKVNEFFVPTWNASTNKLTLTPTSVDVVLSADVPTTLVFKFTDNHGHEHTLPALTFTMKAKK